MSGWLARGSQRGEALMSRFRGASPLKDKDLDAVACFESFRIHWQQAWEMMQAHQGPDATTADDVNCVLNHVDQVCTLLMWDLKDAEQAAGAGSAADGLSDPSAPRRLRIFDLFLSERVLERLLDWSALCGPFEEQLRLEQLRIYEQLLRQAASALLVQRAVLRPLTSLLAGCRAAEQPVELHRRLVLVLAQLCAALHRQPPLLDLFLGLDEDGQPTSFSVFAMLVDFVHRDGVIGRTDREALLLCMRLSRENLQLAQYIVQHSNFCPVLATGLSGLYSVLPRKLLVVTEDRYQLLSADSKQVPELHSFVCSLDFCNSVLQVCHPLIADQLLDYVYQGFLVSVMGPALHQGGSAAAAQGASPDSNSMEEIITATAYLDLFLRSIDQPGLVRTFLRLILAHRYEERRIIDTLVQRIAATSKLCVVTLSLLHTLLDLNCEDVMLELVFRHLLPCTHVMVSQRTRVREPDQHGGTARKLLELVPVCCGPPPGATRPSEVGKGDSSNGRQQLSQSSSAPPAGGTATTPAMAPAGKPSARQPPKQSAKKASKQSSSPAQPPSSTVDGAAEPTASPAPVEFALQSHMSEFFEYTMDARAGVRACRRGCAGWTHAYDGVHPSPADAYRMLRAGDSPPPPAVERNGEHPPEPTVDETGSIGESSGYQSFNPRLSPSPPPGAPEDALFWALVERVPTPEEMPTLETSCAELDEALASLGVIPTAEEINGDEVVVEGRPPLPLPLQLVPEDGEQVRETPQSPTEMFGLTPSMGPFLDLLLTRLEEATTNGLQLNLQLMTVLTRLSLYPQPLLRSCLLDQSIVLQPSVRSLLQTLGKLKHRIDVATAALPQLSELVRWARARLAAREEQPVAGSAPPAPATKSEPRRLSLNSVASMLRRSLGGSGGGGERPLEPTADGFRYTPRPASSGSRPAAEDGAARRLVTAAVLLEQWLLELAAVSQEHAVACEYWEFSCF
ncbi:FHF complex subunit HOOK interacting protein 1B-like isoform X1 [Amphibalanus amphitrite]|uniref:FHF complex subunit HOOK interacting protein 1B-like isoform X1 n=1 Tax=Amphibalanus amphitrite TaxID=1232801 RepID=UPI001C904D0D|nr:FHF complex subunit HOOK interacting protein 1B-like isoform X1 [Amphibalanus amphitrite]XP_043237247.1 FHF complex subunit HOOK interacting protein 1B-like isoform X1 [Amphibalanus amphitrite]